MLQYLERLPDKLIPKKQELLDELRGRIASGAQANAAAGAAVPQPGSPISSVPGQKDTANPAQGGPLDATKQIQGLPTQAMAAYDQLPNIAKKTARAMGNLRAT